MHVWYCFCDIPRILLMSSTLFTFQVYRGFEHCIIFVAFCFYMLLYSVVSGTRVCNILYFRPHRVGVGFPDGLKLLHLYAEFSAAPNFYTFTLLAHFLLRALRARVSSYF